MKLKNKIYTLTGLFTIIFLTTAPTIKEVYGALTPPTSYDLNYQYSSSIGGFTLGTSSVGDYYVGYNRTPDGVYYNYTTTITHNSHVDSLLPEGLEITMTFNRSNTNWFNTGSLYYPEDTKIGSDNTVGSIDFKVSLTFNNQTSKDYRLHFDISSTLAARDYRFFYNTNTYGYDGERYTLSNSTLNRIYIPALTSLQIRTANLTQLQYFDAWYLQDLGLSDAYQQGLDDGYINGQNDADLLITGFQAMVGILVNFFLMIINLEVFGVSILGIASIVILFTGIVWVLKLIRG
jgi:hypothetical protein